ncbi:MAG: uncharacterized protein KVP18_003075 [Porospora cf. gigantea A]|uniref:uncharacterized protein n=1 Tax=Porospora cf. gigantea A TaxID=2853593 RepID=UPI00355A71DB|nr:MAG: hypothetical protein KVP18_003075 [Porospora cf. gigantea A]
MDEETSITWFVDDQVADKDATEALEENLRRVEEKKAEKWWAGEDIPSDDSSADPIEMLDESQLHQLADKVVRDFSINATLFEPLKLKSLSSERPVVFLSFRVNHQEMLPVEITLFSDIVPYTAENFRRLCTGESTDARTGQVLSYRGTSVLFCIPRFIIQAGDTTNDDGTGGQSALGRPYLDAENYLVKHYRAGIVGMCTSCNDNSIASQFYITCAPAPWLDGRNVAVGYVSGGQRELADIERWGTGIGKPACDIAICNSGEIEIQTGKRVFVYSQWNKHVPSENVEYQHGSFVTDDTDY